jgi:glycosyltransferase involved in cell wall biosynthesis
LQELDNKNRYVLFLNYFRKRYQNILRSFEFNDNFHIKAIRVPHKIANYLFDTFHIPIEIVIGKVDVFHGPIYTRLNNIIGKSIVTIHDLIFIRHPEIVHPSWLAYTKKNVTYSIERADALVAISEFTKSELIDIYHIPEEKIRVIYNGVDRDFVPRTEGIEKVKRKFAVNGGYFLFVGANEPRKNLVTLLEAYYNLPRFIKVNFKLVVVGVKRYRSDDVFNKVRELKLEKALIFTGRVTKRELSILYSGAEVFIFPSLLEGFGMPPLEAMACGTPVIASNLTAIPEVISDGGLLIDPRNPDEITQAIEKVLNDNNLKEKLRQKGFERARQFSWRRTARETLSLYNEIA